MELDIPFDPELGVIDQAEMRRREKLARLDAKERHRQNRRFRGRVNKHDTAQHHLPEVLAGWESSGEQLPRRRNRPRGR